MSDAVIRGAPPPAPPKTGGQGLANVNLFAFVQRLAADLGGELELPGFPDVVVRIHQAVANEKSEAKDIVRLVSSEPALVARLLQLANSAAFNPGDKAVAEVRNAVRTLGFNMVRSVATSFAVRQLQQQDWLRAIRPRLSRIWDDSTGVAATAYVSALRFGMVRPDEALTAGLFHQLGSLYVLTRAHRDGIPLDDEQAWAEIVTGWQPTIGRAILECWGTPAHLAEAVEAQDALGDDDLARLPVLVRVVATAKGYHELMKDPNGSEAALLRQRLGRVPVVGQNYLEIMTQAQPDIDKVRHVLRH